MGGHPYWYFVPYQENIQEALNALRQREFQAGRYNPATRVSAFSARLECTKPWRATYLY